MRKRGSSVPEYSSTAAARIIEQVMGVDARDVLARHRNCLAVRCLAATPRAPVR